ncbi:MmgE/PrpD family protein [Ramlibacter sp.]|uniref:MmgE/PrpD family protein n=1 Tax=Ramlibacter sp. TaxID=1917967 RepID=UPI00262F52F6|nr:MmgE/PrpD family protein [Ramlibacter sp.]
MQHDMPTETGFARALAERSAHLQWDDLPPEAVHWAKVGLIDTLGVTLAGSREDAPRLAARGLDLVGGPALVLGSAQRVGPLDAALINGTAAHALDFDDCNNTLGGHPSVPVLPALMALADERDAQGQAPTSGRDFLLAYIVGFEVETKIGLAVNFHHYQKGWHPTSTLGTFGAAAACARLMGLDSERTAVALALAASFASGIKANFGTMTKPLHVGHCARNGLFAARLAQQGFTANAASVFEHEQGFLDVFNGPGTYDTARALDAWAAPLDIVRPGIAIKQYPCCGSTHPAIDCLLALVREHHYNPAQVARVQAWVHPRRLKHTNRPQPKSALDAKFSLQYVLARGLVDGCVSLEHFEGQAYEDPRVQALMPRVEVAGYGEDQFPADNHFGGIARVTLADGTVHEARVHQPLGRTSDHPLPQDLLEEKFALCAASVLTDAGVKGVAAEVAHLEQAANLSALGQHLAQLRQP